MSRKGQVTIAAVFVLVIIAFLGLIITQMLSMESFSAVKNLHGFQALNVAEGGMRFTVAASLAADSDWSNNVDFGPVSLGPGSFTVRYLSKAQKTCSLEVTGTVQGVSRVIRSGFHKTGGGVGNQWNDYAAYGGSAASLGNEMLFNNNSRCIGNLYYYGPVRWAGPWPPARQTGGVIRSVSIDPLPAVGVPNCYASWEQISSYDTPTFESSYYDAWLAAANVSTSNTLVMSSGTLDLDGGTRWYRYADVSGGTINGPGTICATANPSGGYIRLRGSAKVNGRVRFIARGNSSNPINIYPNTSPVNTVFNSSVEVIGMSYMTIQNRTVISPESIIYVAGNDGKYGVQIQDDAQVRGSTVIAPVGVIRVMNNATMEGRIYAESIWTQDSSRYFGTSWVFLDMVGGAQIKDWSVLTQQSAGMPSSLAPGLSPGSGSSSNPSIEADDWVEYY